MVRCGSGGGVVFVCVNKIVGRSGGIGSGGCAGLWLLTVGGGWFNLFFIIIPITATLTNPLVIIINTPKIPTHHTLSPNSNTFSTQLSFVFSSTFSYITNAISICL